MREKKIRGTKRGETEGEKIELNMPDIKIFPSINVTFSNEKRIIIYYVKLVAMVKLKLKHSKCSLLCTK